MDISILKIFLLWCSIINGGLLIFTFVILAFTRDWAFAIHSKLFGISREPFNNMIYCFMGVYKMLWIIFNVVPYIALVIAA